MEKYKNSNVERYLDLVKEMGGNGEGQGGNEMNQFRRGGGLPRFEGDVGDSETKSGELPKAQTGVQVAGPLYDLNGKCFSGCGQRNYLPEHNLSIGTKFNADKVDDQWGIGMGAYAGYSLNPLIQGRRQEGLKGYLGANYGARLSDLSMSGLEQGVDPTITPYSEAVASIGYEGEVGDAGSYANYLRGRRGDPLKWGLGAFGKYDIMGDKGLTVGGYGNYGNLNANVAYNPNSGWAATLGFGVTIRKDGGSLPKAQLNLETPVSYTIPPLPIHRADATYVHPDYYNHIPIAEEEQYVDKFGSTSGSIYDPLIGNNPYNQWISGASNQMYASPQQKQASQDYAQHWLGAAAPIPILEGINLTSKGARIPGLIDDAIINPVIKGYKGIKSLSFKPIINTPTPRATTFNKHGQLKTSFDDQLKVVDQKQYNEIVRAGKIPARDRLYSYHNGYFDIKVRGNQSIPNNPWNVQITSPKGPDNGFMQLLRSEKGFYHLDMSMPNRLDAGQAIKYLSEYVPKGAIIKTAPNGSLSLDSYKLITNQIKRGKFSHIPSDRTVQLNMMSKDMAKIDVNNAGMVTKTEADKIVKDINKMLDDAGIKQRATATNVSENAKDYLTWKVEIPELAIKVKFKEGGELPKAQNSHETDDKSLLERGFDGAQRIYSNMSALGNLTYGDWTWAKIPDFNEAFAKASAALGPNKEFAWIDPQTGKFQSYTTNTEEGYPDEMTRNFWEVIIPADPRFKDYPEAMQKLKDLWIEFGMKQIWTDPNSRYDPDGILGNWEGTTQGSRPTTRTYNNVIDVGKTNNNITNTGGRYDTVESFVDELTHLMFLSKYDHGPKGKIERSGQWLANEGLTMLMGGIKGNTNDFFGTQDEEERWYPGNSQKDVELYLKKFDDETKDLIREYKKNPNQKTYNNLTKHAKNFRKSRTEVTFGEFKIYDPKSFTDHFADAYETTYSSEGNEEHKHKHGKVLSPFTGNPILWNGEEVEGNDRALWALIGLDPEWKELDTYMKEDGAGTGAGKHKQGSADRKEYYDQRNWAYDNTIDITAGTAGTDVYKANRETGNLELDNLDKYPYLSEARAQEYINQNMGLFPYVDGKQVLDQSISPDHYDLFRGLPSYTNQWDDIMKRINQETKFRQMNNTFNVDDYNLEQFRGSNTIFPDYGYDSDIRHLYRKGGEIVKHTIVKGDTGKRLKAMYGAELKDILKHNDLKYFKLGAEIEIPKFQKKGSFNKKVKNLFTSKKNKEIDKANQQILEGTYYEEPNEVVVDELDTYGDSYNLYDIDINDEDKGHESTSYNDYVKNIELYGIDVANQIYMREGKSKLPTEVIQSNSTLGFDPHSGNFSTMDKLNKKYNVGIEGKNFLPKGFDFNTYDPDKAWLDNAPGTVKEIEINDDKPTNIKGSLNSGDILNGWTPEWTLEELKHAQTPDTWDPTMRGTGHYYNPFNAAARAGFDQEWNRFGTSRFGRRIEGDGLGLFDGAYNYYTGTPNNRTYKPSYGFGNDAREMDPETNDNLIFYADADGNPVGTHYTNGTSYTQRILDWRDNSNNSATLDDAIIDDGSQLKADYERGEDVLYRDVPLAAAAITSPYWAPALGTGLASAGEATYAAVLPYTSAPAVIGGTTIPGLTMGNLFNAYGISYGATNIVPDAIDFYNDPSWGGLGNLGLDALGIFGIKNTPRFNIPKVPKVNAPKVDVPKFKSDINWSKWNKNISTSQIDEYNYIEKITKQRGTYMKNTDGSVYSGTPEQFIQMKSKNFNVSYPEGSTTVYRGQDYADDFLETKNFGFADDAGTGFGGNSKTYTGKFTGDKNIAGQYGNVGDNKKFYELAMKNNSKNSININAMGKDYGSLDFIGKSKSYFQSSVKSQQKIVDDLINSKAATSQIDEATDVLNRSKRALDNYDKMASNPNYQKLVNDIKSGKFKSRTNKEGMFTTDDLAKWLEQNNLDNIIIDDVYDYAHGTTNISNQVPGNFLKSLEGNQGTFDLTNPSIYKKYGGRIK